MLLSAEQISKTYGTRKVLDRVSLYLEAGQKLGVIGVNGTGKSTLLRILAGAEEPDEGRVSRDPNVRLNYLPQLPAFDEEHFTVVFCKNSGRMIKTFEVAKGGLMSTIVDVRVILREALLCSATIIYLSHNHPSGFLKPSSEDISITNRIKEAANIMGIKVMDHLIVGNGTYYSFSDEGQI